MRPYLHVVAVSFAALCVVGCTRGQIEPKATEAPPPVVHSSLPSPETSSVPAPTVSQPTKNSNGNENELSTPMGFKAQNINLYVTDESGHVFALNFFSDKIHTYHHYLLNRLERIEIFSGGAASTDEIYIDYYPGLSVHYHRTNGEVIRVRVDSADSKIQNGISVGSSKNDVLRLFPNGFSTWYYGTEHRDPSIYYYLQMSGTDSGTGYTFHFDQDNKVKAIELGLQAFVP